MKVVFGLSISTILRLYIGIYYFMKYLHTYVYIMCTDGETYRYTSCVSDVIIIITISYSDLGWPQTFNNRDIVYILYIYSMNNYWIDDCDTIDISADNSIRKRRRDIDCLRNLDNIEETRLIVDVRDSVFTINKIF